MFMANTNKIKYTNDNSIFDGAITNNNASLGVDTAVDYGPTNITGFWQGVTPNNGGYTIYKVSETEQPRIVVAEDDNALIFFANSFGDRSDITTVTDAILYFKDNLGYFITNRKFDSITTSGMTLMYDPGLVQSYPKSGTTMDNLGSQGQGNNGPLMYFTENGSPVDFVDEKGGSLRFHNYGDGDGSYATASESSFLNDFTYNVWFKVNSIAGPWMAVTSRDGGCAQIGMWANDPSGAFIEFYDEYGGVSIYNDGGNPQIVPGKWYNVTVRHIEGETTQLYLDNVLIGEDTTNTNLYNESLNTFFIGNDGTNGYFDGQIGHVARYDRALSVAEIEKNYNALHNRYYGASTGQTGFFMSGLSGGTTFAYVILDPATGTVSNPIDTGISYNDYNQDDVKPLNHSGYGLYFNNKNNNNDKIVQFIDAFGTLIESYSGTTSNYDTDDLEGKVLYALFHDLGVLKYFDGISVGTYTYDTNNENVNVEWEDDGASRDNSFIIRCTSGNTVTRKILNASRSGVVSLPSYDNSVYSVNARLYDNGDYVAIDKYHMGDSIYTSFEMYDMQGNIISVNDISSFNYNNRNIEHFGTNKFSILFSNQNDDNQDYKIFAYNGTSVISTTHERGANFNNYNTYSQHYDNPNQSYLSETLTYMFYSNSTGNNGPFSTADYLSLVSVCNGTTGFTVNGISTDGNGISLHWNPSGPVYNDMVIGAGGKVYAMFVLPSGVTYTELVADASILTGLNKWNAGNYVVYETQVDNTHPTFHLVNGTTGALLDQLTFTPAGGYSWSIDNSYSAYVITDYDNSVGWYLNTSTNEFTQFSGQYQNRWTPPTFFRGNDVFTDHPSLVMFNPGGSARILSTTGLSDEFTLPTALWNNYSLYRGNSFISYFYRGVDINQPYVRLIDFSGNTINEFTDVSDSNENFYIGDHNNDVVMAVSGEGLYSGTMRVNIINPDGTTDQKILARESNSGNYWREFNDWHWWD